MLLPRGECAASKSSAEIGSACATGNSNARWPWRTASGGACCTPRTQRSISPGGAWPPSGRSGPCACGGSSASGLALLGSEFRPGKV